MSTGAEPGSAGESTPAESRRRGVGEGSRPSMDLFTVNSGEAWSGSYDQKGRPGLDDPVVVSSVSNKAINLQQSTQYHPLGQPPDDNQAREESRRVATEVGLFLLMGMSGWWTVNAILWAETPIFVAQSPERKRISNLVSVACQFGNFFPFLYKAIFSRRLQKKYLAASILTCQVIAIAAALLCAFGWQFTMTMHPTIKFHSGYTEGGISVGLIAATVLAGGAGCLSNVTFWVMCSRYPGTHTETAMSVGSTIGGLLLASVANGAQQRPNAPPRFSARDFMIGVAAVQVFFLFTSLAALNRQAQPAPGVLLRGITVPPKPNQLSRTPSRTGSGFFNLAAKNELDSESPVSSPRSALRSPLIIPEEPEPAESGADEEDLGEPEEPQSLSPCTRKVILFMMFSVYGMTYTMPSLAPYVVGDYKNHLALYAWINNLTQAGDVLGRASTAIPWIPGFAVLGVMWSVVMAISAVIIAATAMSNQCPTILPGQLAYAFPALFFGYYFTRGYLVTLLYIRVKRSIVDKDDAQHLASNLGLLGQIGAIIGNVVAFALVNFTTLLPQNSPAGGGSVSF